MGKKIIACDLGTGGNKASLYDEDGECLESTFIPFRTYYPHPGWHEQAPAEWFNSVIESIEYLLVKRKHERGDIVCISFSGHSLGVVPLDREGRLLRERTPIWSDTRASNEAEIFFDKVDRTEWYMKTGNGFPPPCYPIFKIMWYKNNEYEMYRKVHKIVGTKDYINYKLTGNIFTDYSYASGSGFFNLFSWRYDEDFIESAGLDSEHFPEVKASTFVVGNLLPEVAEKLGLNKNVVVVCGGVDNSCMALGAKNISEGRVYTSLGSSSWIAVSSGKPVLDPETKPFVFAHVIPRMYTSAMSIFSAGTSLEWVKNNMFRDVIGQCEKTGDNIYEKLSEMASKSPIGANKLIFNPSLAGGSSQEPSPNIRGGYIGIDLGHTREDLIRACFEGIAINLGIVLDELKKHTRLRGQMLMVGGGAKSELWLQIFADVYNMEVLRTNIGQNAGSLGAAGCGAVGTGLWKDFNRIDEIHKTMDVKIPIPENVEKYLKLKEVFSIVREYQGKIGDLLASLDI